MSKTKSIVIIALFTALLCVSGLFLKISFIPPVPFTMQSFFVILGSALLGSKRSGLACLIYIFMGTVCFLPVFTKGGGLWYVLEPTFGYLLALPFAAFLNGFLAKKFREKTFIVFLFFIMSAVLILVAGTLYALIVLSYTTGVGSLWQFALSFFIMFIPAEILKAILAIIAFMQLKRVSLFSRE